MRQLRLHFGDKFVTSSGIHKGKAKIEVCSLKFLEARATRKGSDYSRA
jgi:hypothetical protein